MERFLTFKLGRPRLGNNDLQRLDEQLHSRNTSAKVSSFFWHSEHNGLSNRLILLSCLLRSKTLFYTKEIGRALIG